VRDRAISYLNNKNLKSKLYREETLTLSKLMEIVSQYHDKEALIHFPESQVNSLSKTGRFPFDQKFRCEFPEISMGEWYRLFQFEKQQAAQFCSLGIF